MHIRQYLTSLIAETASVLDAAGWPDDSLRHTVQHSLIGTAHPTGLARLLGELRDHLDQRHWHAARHDLRDSIAQALAATDRWAIWFGGRR
jgi:hypothetical protein